MRLLRHLVPRNDGSGNVILTLSPDERKEPKGKNLVALRAGSVRGKRGNLGRASDCFGTNVPRNDRGGCHCHFLLSLRGSPSADGRRSNPQEFLFTESATPSARNDEEGS